MDDSQSIKKLNYVFEKRYFRYVNEFLKAANLYGYWSKFLNASHTNSKRIILWEQDRMDDRWNSPTDVLSHTNFTFFLESEFNKRHIYSMYEYFKYYLQVFHKDEAKVLFNLNNRFTKDVKGAVEVDIERHKFNILR